MIRNGQKREYNNFNNVVVGDVVILKSGMEIAGDGVMIKGFEIKMDESSLTGETTSMKKATIE